MMRFVAARVPFVVGLCLCALVALNLGGCPPTGTGGNVAPVADDQDVNTSSGTAVNITLSASDANGGDILTFIILSLPDSGAVADPHAGAIATAPYTLADGGNHVLYTPDAGFAGEDSFTFAASDGLVQSAAATVSISVSGLVADMTFDEDATMASLTIEAGRAALVRNNAVLTITGDVTIDGTLFAESGRIRLHVDGELTLNGTIRATDPDAGADDEASLANQAAAVLLVIGDGAVTLGPSAVLNSTGPIVVTDDAEQLERTPSDFFEEVEDVSGDDLATLVPLPPDNPAFDENGPPKINVDPLQQGGGLPPVTIGGVWPPDGAAPPPGDRPVIVFRFNGERDLNLDDWTVNGPPAPAGASADESDDPGGNASGGKGKNGMHLNIYNNGGPINIVNNVVLNLADGGDGGGATAVCATSTGGVGGNSGNFRMTAAEGIDITNGTLTINPGRGGNGGNALVEIGAAGAAGCPGETGRSGTATGGKGGDNTKRLFARGDVSGLENVTIGPLSGGDGGYGDATACDGGPGLPCCDGGKGGDATATGGAGGNASLAIGNLPVGTGQVTGGDGGEALAFAGNGGDGGDCKSDDGGDGGDGGAATATGGAGGSASNDSGAAEGGSGGDATAAGGDGGDGGDSGLGEPGAGGAGGGSTANAGAGGAATTSGGAGEPVEVDGFPGADGEEIDVIVYCLDFRFLDDSSTAVEPGTYEAPVFDVDGTTQLGTVLVTFVEEPGVSYARSDQPVSHVGLFGGRLEIDVSSLQLETPVSGVISGVQIAPLFGSNVSAQGPFQVQALDANGNGIGTRAFNQLPDNSATPQEPQTVSAEFDVEESVDTFRLLVAPESFVTIIRIYLVDP